MIGAGAHSPYPGTVTVAGDIERVAGLLRMHLTELLRELGDQRLATVVVTGVAVLTGRAALRGQICIPE